MKQLISSDEAVQRQEPHTKPCSDCPFARTALNGWLGGLPIDVWVQRAHGDASEPCHVIDNQQCAGLAIYRANVAKKPRDPAALVLPADRAKVFATPMEFQAHHKKLPPLDPRDPDPTREGIFRYHNCYRCKDGTQPCVRGNSHGCEFPHARND
jgi:hypothetical protein